MQIIRDITPTEEPSDLIVTADEARVYIRVDAGELDSFFNDLILTAQRRLERYAGIAFTPRGLTVLAYVDNFIELPYYPINIINTVEVWNGDSWTALTNGGGYNVFGGTTKKVEMTSNFSSEFKFFYSCGYQPGTVPKIFKTAVLKMVADLYEYRENSMENSKPSPNVINAYELMKPYKRINYII
jgi:uncharacterized phiE125 gp8 family phage protein